MISANSSAWPRSFAEISWKTSARSSPAKPRHSSKPRRARPATESSSPGPVVPISSIPSSVAGLTTDNRPFCAISPPLPLVDDERRRVGHRVVERAGLGVVLLGVPVDAVRTAAVGLGVDALYQEPPRPRTALPARDEQVLKVAVGTGRPGGGVEDRVRQADQAAGSVFRHEPEEPVCALAQAPEGRPRHRLGRIVAVEGVVAVPEGEPGVAVRLADGADGRQGPSLVARMRGRGGTARPAGWMSRASGFLPWSAPLGFLLADQEAATAEDQEQRRHEDYRRERVDDGAHAELDHGVDLEDRKSTRL